MNAEIATKIANIAVDCAAEHRAQGWQGGGDDYDLGAFPGDLEALRDALGREPNRSEVLAFEASIKAALDATAEQ